MSRPIFLGAAALAATALAPLAPAHAEAPGYDADRAAITIFAPRVQEEPDSDGIGTTRTLTASSAVYIDDLDLQTRAGRDELKQRVEVAAEETCAWLDDLYPLDTPIGGERQCVTRAVADAEDQIEAAITDFEA